jgi:exodeoxyribonuclease VII small subunit
MSHSAHPSIIPHIFLCEDSTFHIPYSTFLLTGSGESNNKEPAMETSFEEAYQELERVVMQLEQGAATMEEALALYERGTELSQHCSTLLDRAELRVNQLRDREDGGFDEEPF